MAAVNRLTVNLGKPLPDLNAHECLYVHQGDDQKALTVSFKRTVRVVSIPLAFHKRRELIWQKPDDGTTYNLPPNLGNFPLYNVAHYKETLPEGMMLKGGCFMPVHGPSHSTPRVGNGRQCANIICRARGTLDSVQVHPSFRSQGHARRHQRHQRRACRRNLRHCAPSSPSSSRGEVNPRLRRHRPRQPQPTLARWYCEAERKGHAVCCCSFWLWILCRGTDHER